MVRDWRNIDKVTIFNGKDENGNRYLSQFLKDYQNIFQPDMINAGCQRCLNDYYNNYIKYVSSMKTEKKESGFKLREKYNGIPLEFGSATLVTNANITDEIGNKLLKDHPRGEELFEAIPEEEEIVLTRIEVLDKMTRAQLDETATGLGLNPDDYKNKGLIAEAIAEKEEVVDEEE
ncbi:hypothetical protein [Aquimarina intermedia]|uniref:Uncharacterized protein n=1 Tax=Aquimarina intermedia TaxID=350814 RepID=A0A5S5BZ49_9FLAO|nr:hypothetical protein [Aquimarina intermedia]TYP71482.1 hypothetical protein BD809_10964 [Aquimarina intermedia]